MSEHERSRALPGDLWLSKMPSKNVMRDIQSHSIPRRPEQVRRKHTCAQDLAVLEDAGKETLQEKRSMVPPAQMAWGSSWPPTDSLWLVQS